jgi:phosphate:Na+ symporter
VSIGAGLILLALHILIDSLEPAEHAPAVGVVLRAITGDPVLCIVIAGLLTWALHSSVATVLLVMSLAFSNFITPAAALALVVGANLGSAINPVFEGTKRADRTSYRLPLGNLLNRLIGVILITPFLPMIADALRVMQPDMAKMTALFHIGFNVALALVFLPLLDPLARLLTRLLPASPQAEDPSAPKYLEVNALETPSLALADAARETLRMGDVVETMLQKVMTAMMTGDRHLIGEVSRMDNVVDSLDEAIKLYVTRLTRGTLDERESRRAMEIISFTINLEHIGDIIDKNLSELATKKIKRGLSFSGEGAIELNAFHKDVLESLRMAFGVFMSGDVGDARRLVAEKARLRAAERVAAERHLERLREGRPETVETTGLHLDILRDLRRIHSHVCAAAYPVLEAAGELKASAAAEVLSMPVTKAVTD